MKIHPGNFVPHALMLAVLVINLSVLQPAEAAPSTNTNSLSLLTPRSQHTATLLTNGRVLIAGGSATNGSLTNAELYITGVATNTPTGSLNTGRYSHTATLLTNGQVLVAGGWNGTSGFLASAELYVPATTNWTATSNGLATAREYHTATLLTNGMVLVAGGWGSYASLSSAELYNPATKKWTATRAMATARYGHTATLLTNGKVLVTGGYNSDRGFLASAELYDPATGAWTATAHALTTARYGHTATRLTNGRVLVAGGLGSSYATLSSAELYDPASGTWTATSNALTTARYAHTATLLLNGQVLAVAGLNGYYPGYSSLSSAELYDPVAGVWTTNGALATARYGHTATLLTNGTVLVTGGTSTGSDRLSSAELYGLPPQMVQQPLSLFACPGKPAVLSVAASGTAPLSYQWQKSGTNLVDGGDVTGSATTNLTLTNLSQSDTANYGVVITNVFGSVTSSIATLTVTIVPAKGTPVVTNGFIVGAIVTDGGCGYTNSPVVVFSGQGGINAAAYAQISNGSVTNIVITSGGSGYATNTVALMPPFYPTLSIVQILTNTPSATAIPKVVDGFILGATLTSSGSGGYTNTPAVSFTDSSGSGSNATAQAQMSAGSVTNIMITSAGSHYSTNTVINISPTPAISAAIPGATNLLLGQNYQLLIANNLNGWTIFGAAFSATNSAWSPANVWNVANTNQMFFRLQMLP